MDALLFLAWTYAFAAVPFGLVLGTLFGEDVDLRVAGSGNIGATNVVRVHGWRLGAVALGLDVLKGLLPVLIARWAWPEAGVTWLGVVSLTAFLAHVYPIYLAFHGGKGVATGAGAMLGVAPGPTSVAVASWVLVLAVSGRSSVASLAATLVLVAAVSVWRPDVALVVLLLAAGIVQSHLPNLRRLVAGDEGAVVQPVRWGRPRRAPDPADLLEAPPAGGDGPVPALWGREGDAP